MLLEKENLQVQGILEADIIKRAEVKEKNNKRVHQKNEKASRNQVEISSKEETPRQSHL